MVETERTALSVVDLEKSFRLGETVVPVLRGVAFHLGHGEAVAITGPSGSGKSTLLHLLGLLDRPNAGHVRIGGLDPWALPERERARFRNRSVGFVFQDAHLLPQYSVLENVLLPALAFSDGAAGAQRRADELVQRVGLAHRRHHRPAALSGGERQRVAVARALMNSPTLLLCDEPTGSLDAAIARTVADLLFDLQRDRAATLVVVTHSAELAGRFPRRLELSEGRCSEA